MPLSITPGKLHLTSNSTTAHIKLCNTAQHITYFKIFISGTDSPLVVKPSYGYVEGFSDMDLVVSVKPTVNLDGHIDSTGIKICWAQLPRQSAIERWAATQTKPEQLRSLVPTLLERAARKVCLGNVVLAEEIVKAYIGKSSPIQQHHTRLTSSEFISKAVSSPSTLSTTARPSTAPTQPSLVSAISPRGHRCLKITPDDAIRFSPSSTGQSTATLRLWNMSPTHTVVYHILAKTSETPEVVVRPSWGILEPCTYLEVKVTSQSKMPPGGSAKAAMWHDLLVVKFVEVEPYSPAERWLKTAARDADARVLVAGLMAVEGVVVHEKTVGLGLEDVRVLPCSSNLWRHSSRLPQVLLS